MYNFSSFNTKSLLKNTKSVVSNFGLILKVDFKKNTHLPSSLLYKNLILFFLLCIISSQSLYATETGEMLSSYSEETTSEDNLFNYRATPNENIYIKYNPSEDESVYRISWFINNKWIGKPPASELTFPNWPQSLADLGEGIHKVEARIYDSSTSTEYRSVTEYLLVTTDIPNNEGRTTPPVESNSLPKNYVRVIESQTRGLSAVNTIENWNVINTNQTTGFVVQIDWHDLTTDLKNYNFNLIDEILEKKKATDKIWLKIMDRTFHSGCSNSWYPDGIKVIAGKNNTCFVDHTDSQTFEAFKSTLETIAHYYNANSDFEGFIFNETAINAYNIQQKAVYFERLLRYHNTIQKISPNKYVVQYLNWPNDYKLFEKFVQNFLTWSNPRGGIGWPDSIPNKLGNFKQYALARDYGDNVLVFSGAQGALIDLCSETPSIMSMIKDDIKADMILWENWAKSCDYPNVLLNYLYYTYN